jgi:hypothetical protein
MMTSRSNPNAEFMLIPHRHRFCTLAESDERFETRRSIAVSALRRLRPDVFKPIGRRNHV